MQYPEPQRSYRMKRIGCVAPRTIQSPVIHHIDGEG